MRLLIVGLVVAFVLAGVAAAAPIIWLSKQPNDELYDYDRVDITDYTTDTAHPVSNPEHKTVDLDYKASNVVTHSVPQLDVSNSTGTLMSAQCRTSSANAAHVYAVFVDGDTSYATVYRRGDDYGTWRRLVWNQSLGDNIITDMSADAATLVYADSSTAIITLATYSVPDDTTISGTLTTSTIASPTGATTMESLWCDDTEATHMFCKLENGTIYHYDGSSWTELYSSCVTFQQAGDWLCMVTGSDTIRFYTRSGTSWSLSSDRGISQADLVNAWVAHDGSHVIFEYLSDPSYVKTVYRWSDDSWVSASTHHTPRLNDSTSTLQAHVFQSRGAVLWSTSSMAEFFHWGTLRDEKVSFVDQYDSFGIGGTIDTLAGNEWFIMLLYSVGDTQSKLSVHIRRVAQ